MGRWEYREVVRAAVNTSDFVADLNRLGASGWELVGIASPDPTVGVNRLVGILKRAVDGEPVPDPPTNDAPGALYA